MSVKTKLIIITASILCTFSCHNNRPTSFVLSDFESEADLDRVQWRCHTLFSLSDENVTNGSKSLKLVLYPSDYPGITFALSMHNWSSYQILSLYIFNPQDEVISLAMRIDDMKEYPDFKERYNHSFPIKPGMNHLRIPLASLFTSGTKRSINLKNIHRCMIFMAYPPKKYVLYIDYVHLA